MWRANDSLPSPDELRDGAVRGRRRRCDRDSQPTRSDERLDRLLGAELGDAMAEADWDDDVRAVVVTGAGRAFCGGRATCRPASSAVVTHPGCATCGRTTSANP